MSVMKDGSGRRSVKVEVELPGTPEQIWQAIATGPGISSWFVPTDIEEREGGALAFHMGPGADSVGTVTGWEPPRRFAYEERDWMPDAPPVATECLVEARSGGVCVLRLVHSLFASGEDWDNQLESFESGWPGFFRILRLYLVHFRGLPCSSVRVTGSSSEPESKTWELLTRGLDLEGAAPAQRRAAPPSVPAFSGVVEDVGDAKSPHELLLRLDAPAPGIASMGTYTWGGQVHAAIYFYLYGNQAAEMAAAIRPAWEEWTKKLFPSVAQ